MLEYCMYVITSYILLVILAVRMASIFTVLVTAINIVMLTVIVENEFITEVAVVIVDIPAEVCSSECEHRIINSEPVTLFLIYVCYSWCSVASLLDRALAHWRESRRSDFLLTGEQSKPENFVSMGQEFREDVKGKEFVEKILNQFCPKPKKLGSKNRDAKHMDGFLKVSKQGGFPDIESDLASWMPGRAPAIYHLIAQKKFQSPEADGGWQYPSVGLLGRISNRAGIDAGSYSGVSLVELTLSEFGNKEWDKYMRKIHAFKEDDNKMMPGNVLSFDVENVQVVPEAWEYLKNWKNLSPEEQDKPVDFRVPTFWEKGTPGIPARMIIGNGITWMASLRFPWEQKYINGEKRMVFNVSRKFDPTTLQTILDGKALVGSGVVNDVQDITNIIKILYGIDLLIPPPLPLPALALCAGYRFPRANLFSLQLILTGGVHNKLVSCADNTWGQPFNKLDHSLQLYALADVRHGYMCYVVLMSLIIEHLFPDPVVVGSHLNLNHHEAYELLCTLIIHSLTWTKIHDRSYALATTRQDLLRSLRKEGYEASLPVNLRLLNEMMPPWPTPTYGGARDLSMVSKFFATKQADNLTELYKVQRAENKYTLLSFSSVRTSPVSEAEVDWLTSRRGCKIPEILTGTPRDRPVTYNSSLRSSVLELSPEKLTYEHIMSEVQRTGQPRVLGIEEWARTALPWEVQIVLLELLKLNTNLLNKEYRPIWIDRPAVYLKVKTIYQLRTNEPAFEVPILEDMIRGKSRMVIGQEVAKANRLRAAADLAEMRAARMKADDDREKSLPRHKIDLQGRHYATAPKSASLATIKRKDRRKRSLNRLLNQLAAQGKIQVNPDYDDAEVDMHPVHLPGGEGAQRKDDYSEAEVHPVHLPGGEGAQHSDYPILSEFVEHPVRLTGGEGAQTYMETEPVPGPSGTQAHQRQQEEHDMEGLEDVSDDDLQGFYTGNRHVHAFQSAILISCRNQTGGVGAWPQADSHSQAGGSQNWPQAALQRAEEMGSIPEALLDPATPPSGYSDISDNEMDFSSIYPKGWKGKSKKKGKSKANPKKGKGGKC